MLQHSPKRRLRVHKWLNDFERRDFSAWWLLPGCLVIIVLIALIVLLARKLF